MSIPERRAGRLRFGGCVAAILLMFVAPTSRAVADPVVFHFDDSPGGEFNPSFTEGLLSVSFSTDESINPLGVVQFSNDLLAIPYAGPGNLRLTQLGSGGGPAGAFMDFSADVFSVDLYAFQCTGAGAFQFTALDAIGNTLGSFATTILSDCETEFIYEHLQFSSPTGIRRVRLLGTVNSSVFDVMTVTVDGSTPTTGNTWGRVKTLYR